MPTPIAHGVAAWATARTVKPDQPVKPWLFGLVALLAIAPDLDFIPGLLLGDPGAFHRSPTHSLAGALAASSVIAWMVSGPLAPSGAARRSGWFGLVLATYCAHLALDLMVPDKGGAWGIPLFWPLSDGYVRAVVPIPAALRRLTELQLGTDNGTFLAAILSGRTLAVFLIEGLLFTPLLLAPKLIGSFRRRIPAPGPGSAARELPGA